MEASSSSKTSQDKETRISRPHVFNKMERLVREMQDPENGVPVRSQKQFLTSIPSAFMGYDLIEWLMERLSIEESVEAVHIANQLCHYGYYFPVNDYRNLTVKDDSSLYRFQIPYYWPWQNRTPDNLEYAIYLTKRTLRNKQRHSLEEYEVEAFDSLKRNLQNKWDIIQLQAEEQIRLTKDRKKGDKIVSDSQERAFWRVYRPPPGCSNSLEIVPVPSWSRHGSTSVLSRKRTLTDIQREVEFFRKSVTRTRIKVSAAIENLINHYQTYVEFDPMISPPQPSNPWITEDQTFWHHHNPIVETPIEKRVKRWGISLEELMSDPTGLQEFTNYLRKEYSHENIRFWLAVKDLRRSHQAKIGSKVAEIFKEFLAPGAPCEINIDGKTMERVNQEMKNPTRFSFDSAAEHVYTLLLKKDCYPRFTRSDHYRNLLATGVQPQQKKRFFAFGAPGKKKAPSATVLAPASTSSQHQSHELHDSVYIPENPSKRRDSDRSLSGSAHELAQYGIRDIISIPQVSHSQSQSNLTNIICRSDAKTPVISISPVIGAKLEHTASVETTKSDSLSKCPLSTIADDLSSKKSEIAEKTASQSVAQAAASTSATCTVAATAATAAAVATVSSESVAPTPQVSSTSKNNKKLLAQLSDATTTAQVEASDIEKFPDSQKKTDNNNTNEICPWEDEDSCKVDTPYVKTYATLGYL